MKLASLKIGGRDGTLVVVSKDLTRIAPATGIAKTMQEALESWDSSATQLAELSSLVDSGAVETQPYEPKKLASPLPRSFQWADGSAYLSHMRLVRKARGAEMPPGSETDPLIYQGGGDYFLGPVENIPCGDEAWGLDFEGEIAVVVGDVPASCSVSNAVNHIRLIMLCNDVSLRHVMKSELQKGFGFYQSKPASSFSPVCVTPDELGQHWTGVSLERNLRTLYNGVEFGNVPAADDLNFDFADLIAHAAKTRELRAGTIIGSGTVSHTDHERFGSSCLAEKRMIEILRDGEASTRFMKPGDTVRFEMLDDDEKSIFGAIDQTVVSV